MGGDFNLDGTVGFDDLLIPVRNLGKTGSGLAGDANLDGVVAIDDVVIPAKNLDKAESPWP